MLHLKHQALVSVYGEAQAPRAMHCEQMYFTLVLVWIQCRYFPIFCLKSRSVHLPFSYTKSIWMNHFYIQSEWENHALYTIVSIELSPRLSAQHVYIIVRLLIPLHLFINIVEIALEESDNSSFIMDSFLPSWQKHNHEARLALWLEADN